VLWVATVALAQRRECRSTSRLLTSSGPPAASIEAFSQGRRTLFSPVLLAARASY
jgi:hypothetical protein